MSRKHNTKHPERGRKTPRTFGRLEPIEGRTGLRVRQERREKETGVPWPTAASRRVESEAEAA